MNKKPFIIGITGGSGSGKTVFLKCFLDHFPKHEVCLISQDDYYFLMDGLSGEDNKLYNFDLPAAIDDQLFLTDIRKLMSGETIYKKEYTFNKPGAVPKILEISPAPIIIVEGLFILHFEEIASLLDLKLFIDSDEEIALQRRIKRDEIERGYPEDDVRYKWDNHVVLAYSNFLLPHKDTCDKVVSNNTNTVIELKKIAEELSREIKAKI
jgi:uridine kinase